MSDKKYPKVRTRNGVSTYRYSVTDPKTGHRIQKETPGYSSEIEAFKAGMRIEEGLQNNSFVVKSGYKVSEWIDKWVELYQASGRVKKQTVDDRKNSLSILRREMGGMRLKAVTVSDYQDFLNGLRKPTKSLENGYSKNTILTAHSAARMLFKKAKSLKMIEIDPTIDIEIPAFQQTVVEIENGEELPKFLEKEHLAKLLNLARESGEVQFYHALTMLAYTGLRIGELCALRPSDIDYTMKRLSVTKTLYRTRGIKNYQLDPPKTKSGIRKVDLGNTVFQIIKKQESYRNEIKMARRDVFYEGDNFLFINEHTLPGYPMSPLRLGDFLRNLTKNNNLPSSITLHSLRHTYTTLMAEAGVELTSIQKMLGHKKDKVTEQVYLHVTAPKRREAVDRLDALMEGLL